MKISRLIIFAAGLTLLSAAPAMANGYGISITIGGGSHHGGYYASGHRGYYGHSRHRTHYRQRRYVRSHHRSHYERQRVYRVRPRYGYSYRGCY